MRSGSLQPEISDSSGAVYLGDCAEILPRLGVQADLILTSPPYDNLRDYGGSGFDFDTVADACIAALSPGGVLVWIVSDETVDGSETGTSFRQALGLMERGLRLHDTMIYERMLPRYIKTERRYPNAFEFMFVFANGRPNIFNPIKDRPNAHAGTSLRRTAQFRHPDGQRSETNTHYGKPLEVATHGKRSNVWRFLTGSPHSAPDYSDAHKHPAIFPLALAKDHIRTWTEEGGLVLDPMAGSGTALRAAKDLGRRYIGVEVHEPYLDLIRARLAQGVLL